MARPGSSGAIFVIAMKTATGIFHVMKTARVKFDGMTWIFWCHFCDCHENRYGNFS
jgi:hypothetical protein